MTRFIFSLIKTHALMLTPARVLLCCSKDEDLVWEESFALLDLLIGTMSPNCQGW